MIDRFNDSTLLSIILGDIGKDDFYGIRNIENDIKIQTVEEDISGEINPEEKKEEPIKADKANIREEKQTVQIFPIEVNIDNTKQPEKVKIKKTIKITTDSQGKISGGEVEEIES